MRITAFTRAVLVVSILSGGSGLRGQQSQPPVPGAISGIVVDAVTGSPLPGARVTLVRTSGGGAIARFVTDSKGRFVFESVPPAPNYFLDASRPGFASTRYGWTRPGGSSAISDILLVPVKDGQWVSEIKIPLWRNGSISGRVVDERNEPVVGVIVRAYTMVRMAGRMQPVFGGLARTDDRGAYRFPNVSPGQYTIAVPSVQSTVLSTTRELPATKPLGGLAPSGVSGGRGSFVSSPGLDVDGKHRLVMTNYATPPPPSDGRPRAYPATYFPGVTRMADAQVIAVDYGVTKTAVDIQIAPVPAVTVSGRVTGITGTMPNMLLRLLPAGYEGLGFSSEAATTPLDTDGSFTFLNVPTGDYTLLAQTAVIDFSTSDVHLRVDDAPGFPGRGAGVGSMTGVPGAGYLSRTGEPSTVWGRMPVSVGAQPIANLTLAMSPTVSVRGRVVFDTGTKPPARLVFLDMSPANGDPSLGEPGGRFIDPPSAFAFEITGLLGGTYLLNPGTIGRYGVMSTMANGRDVTYSGFDGSLGKDFDDVVITVTDRRPTLSGVVQGSAGPTRAGVMVFPQDRTRWTNFGWSPTWLQHVGTSAVGAYTFDSLPEGEYFVVAVDVDSRQQVFNPEFLAKVAASASRVSLKWGGTVNQDLKIVEVK